MKQLLFALTVLVSLTLASCGGGAGDPKKVANEYLTAFGKMDFEKAKKVSTDDTKKFIDMMSSFSAMVPDSVKKKSADTKVEIQGDAVINGDDATVSYVSGDKSGAQTLKLKKVNGKWLVQQTKEDSGMGAETPAANPDEAVAADTTQKAK